MALARAGIHCAFRGGLVRGGYKYMPGFQSALVIGASALLLVLFGWRIWRIFHPRPSPLDHPALFFTLVFAAMLVLRWGMIFSDGD